MRFYCFECFVFNVVAWLNAFAMIPKYVKPKKDIYIYMMIAKTYNLYLMAMSKLKKIETYF